MGWGIMYNGAWDYASDTCGYTWGWVHEFHTQLWSFRYGSAAEPKIANGIRFDRRVLRDRADMFEAELHYKRAGHAGAIRVRASSIVPTPEPMPPRSGWQSSP